MTLKHFAIVLPGLLLAACQNGSTSPNITAEDAAKFDAISAEETLNFGGNEPFWGGQATGERLLYTTPENIDGTEIAVTRFAGMNGLGLSGELGGLPFDMAVTEAECDDTMADRTYPFTITLSIGDEIRNGCGWTAARPFEGSEAP